MQVGTRIAKSSETDPQEPTVSRYFLEYEITENKHTQDILWSLCNNAFFCTGENSHGQVEKYSKQLINHKYRTNVSVQLKITNANAEGISD